MRRGYLLAAAAAMVGIWAAPASNSAPKAVEPKGPARKESAEPTEAQLRPVDPAWRAKGWRAVVPHAYVLRKLAPARVEPDKAAEPAFWLAGGTRVPVLEQGRSWWRVGWTKGRTGWMPVADLEPTASFIMVDTGTARVTRRYAGKGRWGVVSDGQTLWSISNTGITRMIPEDRPEIWSNPVRLDADGMMPYESVWTPDLRKFFLLVGQPDGEKLAAGDVATGEIRLLPNPPEGGTLTRADARQRVLIPRTKDRVSEVILYDTTSGKETGRAAGWVDVTSKDGSAWISRENEIVRCDADLKVTARAPRPAQVESVCLSTDEKYLALTYEVPAKKKTDASTYRVRVLRAQTLEQLADFQSDPRSPRVIAVSPVANGWMLVTGGFDENSNSYLSRFDRAGNRLRSWTFRGMFTTSPDGKTFYLLRENEVLKVQDGGAKTELVRFSWRRPLPVKYIPKPSDPGTPTHPDISSMTLTPDGKTLILTEWLNGDPAG